MSEAEYRIERNLEKAINMGNTKSHPAYYGSSVHAFQYVEQSHIQEAVKKKLAVQLPDKQYVKMIKDLSTAPYKLSDKQRRALIHYLEE